MNMQRNIADEDAIELSPVQMMSHSLVKIFKAQSKALRRDSVVLQGRCLDRLAADVPGIPGHHVVPFVEHSVRELNGLLAPRQLAIVGFGSAAGNPSIKITRRG